MVMGAHHGFQQDFSLNVRKEQLDDFVLRWTQRWINCTPRRTSPTWSPLQSPATSPLPSPPHHLLGVKRRQASMDSSMPDGRQRMAAIAARSLLRHQPYSSHRTPPAKDAVRKSRKTTHFTLDPCVTPYGSSPGSNDEPSSSSSSEVTTPVTNGLPSPANLSCRPMDVDDQDWLSLPAHAKVAESFYSISCPSWSSAPV